MTVLIRAAEVALVVKNLTTSAVDWSLIPGTGRKWQPIPVVLPGEIPWTEEPGELQFMGSQSWT